MGIIETKSAAGTARLGQQVASFLAGRQSRRGVVLGLVGELGSGKTTFIQGLARGLGIKSRIISPTFVLQRRYRIPSAAGFKNLYHVDIYRLNRPEESVVLGLSEIWSDPKSILVIEWADKIRSPLPLWTHWITFSQSGEKGRKISSNLLTSNSLK